ncbi:MAG: PAS-domain containing protein [Alphaproteobacteria bacterium]|nr:PAS-domain containing protein [Alphaproteobacteria bacterium]
MPPATRAPIAAMVAIFAAVVLAAVGGTLGYILKLGYDSAIADAQRETRNTARLLEEHTAQVLGGVDTILAGIVGDLGDTGHAGWLNPPLLESLLATRLTFDGPVNSIAVIDAAGTLVARAGRPGAPIGSLSERDYVRTHRYGSADLLHVGAPFRSALTFQEILPVSRRISARDGGFVGVALVTIEPAYLRRFYGSLNVGDNGMVALFHVDGTPVVVAPPRAAASLVPGDGVRRMLGWLPVVDSGTRIWPGDAESDASILSYRRVAGRPLMTIAAQSRSDVLADWYATVWWYLAVMVLALVIIATLSAALLRYVARIARAEAALRASQAAVASAEQRLRDAIDSLTDGFLLWDADDRLVMTNAAIAQLDSARAARLRPGVTYQDVLRQGVEQGLIGAAVGRENAFVAERLHQHRNPGGEPVEQNLSDGRWIELRERRTKDGGVVSIRRDITAQKNREAEIERQRALLEMAFASVDQGICIYDGEMRLVAANARYCAIRGLPPELAEPGRPIEDSVRFAAARGDYGPGDVETVVADQMRRLAARKRERIAVSLPDGRTVEIQRAPMPNGFLVATYSDVTELKARECEVERQNALLATTMATMENGVSVFDANLRLVAWNDQFLRLFDLPAGFACVGRPYEEIVRLCSARGDYGPGDPEDHVAGRVARMRDPGAQRVTFRRRGGIVMDIRRRVTADGLLVSTYSDVTEQQASAAEIERQRAQLAEQASLLATTLKSVRQGVSVFDRDLRLVAWNDRFIELLQFPRAFGVVGRPFADFIRYNAERGEYGPGDVEDQVAERVALARDPRPHQFLRTRPDGIVLDVQGSVSPAGYLVTTYGDITAHKAHEAEIERQRAELAQKTELLEASLSSIEQGLCVFDADDRLVAWNQRYLELRAYPPEFGSVGRPVEDFVRYSAARGDYGPVDDQAAIARMIDRMKVKGRDRTTLSMPNGTILDVQRTLMPNGYHVATYSDVTAQKQVEAEIERQRAEVARKSEFLELTLNHMAQGIAMIAPDRTVVVSNARIADMLGLPPALLDSHPLLDDVIARQRDGGEFAMGPGEGSVVEQLSRIVDQPYEYQRRRPNGLVIEVSNTPLPGGGAVRTYTDITARKAAEDALRASEERLQLQVNELQDAQARLTRQGAELEATVEKLAAARDAAQAANLAKSDFLTNMSHEIRTPMNGILGNAHLLLDSPLSADQAEWATTIRECGDALLGLINDILDLSKLEAGRVQLEQIDFDLGKTIAGAVGLLQVKAREKNIALIQEIAPEIGGMVRGDPTRLRQVLINLVGNAVKFTEKGHVRVVARPLAGLPRAGAVEVLIIDSGIGISDAAREHLFDKFSQADSSITRRYGGTGLGLAISKQLVELMGGEIGVESRPGIGSTFRFTLQLGRAAVAPDGSAGATPALPAPAPAPAAAALSVLLAEDNPVNQRLATTLLKRLGHDVAVAANGYEAVLAARTAAHDVILMDVQMPELDGIEAARLIREEEGRTGRRTPIVALTAHAMQGARESYLAAGMDDFLTKPIDPKQLEQCVARWGAAGRLAAAPDRPPAPAAVRAQPCGDDLDTAQIAALEGALEPHEIRALVTSFLTGAAERVGRIAAMADATDLAALAREAHDLVGTAGNFGARRVRLLAKDLENACRDGRTDDVRRLVGEVGVAASSADRAMRERFLAA